MLFGKSVARTRLFPLAFGTSLLALSFASATSAAAECTPNPTIANGTTQCTGTDAGGVVVATPNSNVVVAT
jgi:hypothetical protein